MITGTIHTHGTTIPGIMIPGTMTVTIMAGIITTPGITDLTVTPIM